MLDVLELASFPRLGASLPPIRQSLSSIDGDACAVVGPDGAVIVASRDSGSGDGHGYRLHRVPCSAESVLLFSGAPGSVFTRKGGVVQAYTFAGEPIEKSITLKDTLIYWRAVSKTRSILVSKKFLYLLRTDTMAVDPITRVHEYLSDAQKTLVVTNAACTGTGADMFVCVSFVSVTKQHAHEDATVLYTARGNQTRLLRGFCLSGLVKATRMNLTQGPLFVACAYEEGEAGQTQGVYVVLADPRSSRFQEHLETRRVLLPACAGVTGRMTPLTIFPVPSLGAVVVTTKQTVAEDKVCVSYVIDVASRSLLGSFTTPSQLINVSTHGGSTVGLLADASIVSIRPSLAGYLDTVAQKDAFSAEQLYRSFLACAFFSETDDAAYRFFAERVDTLIEELCAAKKWDDLGGLLAAYDLVVARLRAGSCSYLSTLRATLRTVQTYASAKAKAGPGDAATALLTVLRAVADSDLRLTEGEACTLFAELAAAGRVTEFEPFVQDIDLQAMGERAGAPAAASGSLPALLRETMDACKASGQQAAANAVSKWYLLLLKNSGDHPAVVRFILENISFDAAMAYTDKVTGAGELFTYDWESYLRASWMPSDFLECEELTSLTALQQSMLTAVVLSPSCGDASIHDIILSMVLPADYRLALELMKRVLTAEGPLTRQRLTTRFKNLYITCLLRGVRAGHLTAETISGTILKHMSPSSQLYGFDLAHAYKEAVEASVSNLSFLFRLCVDQATISDPLTFSSLAGVDSIWFEDFAPLIQSAIHPSTLSTLNGVAFPDLVSSSREALLNGAVTAAVWAKLLVSAGHASAASITLLSAGGPVCDPLRLEFYRRVTVLEGPREGLALEHVTELMRLYCAHVIFRQSRPAVYDFSAWECPFRTANHKFFLEFVSSAIFSGALQFGVAMDFIGASFSAACTREAALRPEQEALFAENYERLCRYIFYCTNMSWLNKDFADMGEFGSQVRTSVFGVLLPQLWTLPEPLRDSLVDVFIEKYAEYFGSPVQDDAASSYLRTSNIPVFVQLFAACQAEAERKEGGTGMSLAEWCRILMHASSSLKKALAVPSKFSAMASELLDRVFTSADAAGSDSGSADCTGAGAAGTLSGRLCALVHIAHTVRMYCVSTNLAEEPLSVLNTCLALEKLAYTAVVDPGADSREGDPKGPLSILGALYANGLTPDKENFVVESNASMVYIAELLDDILRRFTGMLDAAEGSHAIVACLLGILTSMQSHARQPVTLRPQLYECFDTLSRIVLAWASRNVDAEAVAQAAYFVLLQAREDAVSRFFTDMLMLECDYQLSTDEARVFCLRVELLSMVITLLLPSKQSLGQPALSLLVSAINSSALLRVVKSSLQAHECPPDGAATISIAGGPELFQSYAKLARTLNLTVDEFLLDDLGRVHTEPLAAFATLAYTAYLLLSCSGSGPESVESARQSFIDALALTPLTEYPSVISEILRIGCPPDVSSAVISSLLPKGLFGQAIVLENARICGRFTAVVSALEDQGALASTLLQHASIADILKATRSKAFTSLADQVQSSAKEAFWRAHTDAMLGIIAACVGTPQEAGESTATVVSVCSAVGDLMSISVFEANGARRKHALHVLRHVPFSALKSFISRRLTHDSDEYRVALTSASRDIIKTYEGVSGATLDTRILEGVAFCAALLLENDCKGTSDSVEMARKLLLAAAEELSGSGQSRQLLANALQGAHLLIGSGLLFSYLKDHTGLFRMHTGVRDFQSAFESLAETNVRDVGSDILGNPASYPDLPLVFPLIAILNTLTPEGVARLPDSIYDALHLDDSERVAVCVGKLIFLLCSHMRRQHEETATSAASSVQDVSAVLRLSGLPLLEAVTDAESPSHKLFPRLVMKVIDQSIATRMAHLLALTRVPGSRALFPEHNLPAFTKHFKSYIDFRSLLPVCEAQRLWKSLLYCNTALGNLDKAISIMCDHYADAAEPGTEENPLDHKAAMALLRRVTRVESLLSLCNLYLGHDKLHALLPDLARAAFRLTFDKSVSGLQLQPSSVIPALQSAGLLGQLEEEYLRPLVFSGLEVFGLQTHGPEPQDAAPPPSFTSACLSGSFALPAAPLAKHSLPPKQQMDSELLCAFDALVRLLAARHDVAAMDMLLGCLAPILRLRVVPLVDAWHAEALTDLRDSDDAPTRILAIDLTLLRAALLLSVGAFGPLCSFCLSLLGDGDSGLLPVLLDTQSLAGKPLLHQADPVQAIIGACGRALLACCANKAARSTCAGDLLASVASVKGADTRSALFLFTCAALGDAVRPDDLLSTAWRHGLMNEAMPHLIRSLGSLYDRVEGLARSQQSAK